MTHPNETTLRKAYELFGKGDIPAFLALCTADFRLKVPGKNRLSGDHSAQEFLGAFGQLVAQTDNTFRETVLHVAANDTNGFVIVRTELSRSGEHLRYNAVHHYEITAGKLARFWEFTDDQIAFDRAWR